MLESYITPLLMGYVNKYIKNLKPSDLSLSVWGGDVVLQNLELHLDVLQKELNLPVKFLSGKIHELRIHVPWTRITYEPVEITINTIEFIVKLRDPDEEANDKEEEDSEETKRAMKREMQKAKVQREAEHLPPGYVQSVLNKVVNNITVCVNNLILKYAEDDIVFSLNIKSAMLLSANENWEKAFIELALPSLCLRKICNINDLTVCLDNRNADGKIEMYQDPLLYKCNLSFRILSKYQGIGSSTAYENHVNMYCESFDMSATDLQLPMLVRLLKMCLGLYYRTLDLPGCNYKEHPAKDLLEERKHKETLRKSVNKPTNDDVDDSSWMSWAWSKIPYFSDDLNDIGDMLTSYDHDSVLVFGIYVTQCSLTLKVIEEMSNKSVVGSRRFEFSPVLNIEMSGCAVEMLIKGEEYFDCQMGVSNIVGYLIGDCVCKKGRLADNPTTPNVSFDDINGDEEDELFLRVGSPTETPDDGVGFLKNSLFKQSNDLTEDSLKPTTLPPKGSQFTEAEIMKKFGAFFLDYFYTMELPDAAFADSAEMKQSYNKESEHVKESSSKRLIVGKCQTFLTSKLYHLMTKVIEFATEDGIPPKKVKDKPYIDPFVLEQLKSGNLPMRSLHFTCHSVCLQISFADHPFGKSSDVMESTTNNTDRNNLHGLLIQIDRLDYQANSPMFPVQLNHLIDSDLKANPLFYRAAFTDYYLKTFGIQMGLCQYLHDSSEPTVLNIVAPVHASFYLKNCINQRVGRERFIMELRAETPSINFSLTKAQLLMLISLYESWIIKNPLPVNECLIGDIFHPKATKECVSSVLDLSLIGVQGKYIQTDCYHAIAGSLGSFKVAMQALCDGAALSTAIIHGPLNTARMSNIEMFMNSKDEELLELPNGALLNLKVQVPKNDQLSEKAPAVILFELKGIVMNIDPMLLKWIDYMPSSSSSDTRMKTFQRRTSKMPSRTLSASTPKKKSYSRVYGTSQLSRERHKGNKASKREKGENENTKEFQNQIAYAMLILKSLMIKAEIETIAVVMPTKTLLTEQDGSIPLYNIPCMLRTRSRETAVKFPDCLVLTFPELRLSSSNIKDLENTTDIPVSITKSKPVEDSLPWSLNGQGFSIYTITQRSTTPSIYTNLSRLAGGQLRSECCYIWEPAVWTMFLAASHADPKDKQSTLTTLHDSLSSVGVRPVIDQIQDSSFDARSQCQPSLGLCVHIDLASVMIGISKHQVSVVIDVLSELIKTINNLDKWSSIKTPVRKLDMQTNLSQQIEMNSVGQKSTLTEDDRRSISSTSTAEPLDDVTVSNEASISGFSVQNKSSGDLAVSLWLQWIIPRMSVTLYSDINIQDGSVIYKIPIELDELSLAVDYQKGKVQMTNKIGSFAVRNYILRSESNAWETDRFDGILLSCKDLLGNNIESLSSSKQSNSRSFFNMTYSRILLSDVHSRSRYASIRSEAAITTEDLETEDAPSQSQDPPSQSQDAPSQSRHPSKYLIDEDGIYQHRISLSVQPFDVIVVPEPVVHVIRSLLDADTKPFHQAEKTDPHKPTGPGRSPQECVFQPLPIVTIESKGIRLLVPDIKHPDHDSKENMVVYCLQCFTVSSDPENRINSTVFNKELYRCLKRHHREKSRRTKIWHVQYKIDLKGISLWTGQWTDICRQDISGDEELSLLAEKQNPALEWNYELPKRKDPVHLTPVLLDFNCCATVSPALSVSMKSQKNLGLTATSLEIDFPKEIQTLLNPSQVSLLAEVAHSISRSFENGGSENVMSENYSSLAAKTPDVIDSGVASVLSAKMSELSKDKLKLPVQDSQNQTVEKEKFEVLITAKSLCVTLYVNRSNGEDTKELDKAVLCCQIIQPSANIRLFKETLIELAIHDVLVSSSKTDAAIQGILPDKSSFDQSLLRTEKGKPDSKTGLFSSALSLQIASGKSVDVVFESGRPVVVSVFLDVFKKLQMFVDDLKLSGSPREKTEASTTKLDSYIDSLEFKTNRIDFQVSKSSNYASSSLVTKLRSLRGSADFRRSQQSLDSVDLKCDVEGFEVLVKKDEDYHTLVSPCIFDVDSQADFIKHSGNIYPESIVPKLTICFASGLIRLRFGQQHLEYLNALAAELSATEEHALTPGKVKDSEKLDEDHLEAGKHSCDVEYSYDDLRTRPFQYVVKDGKEGPSHPCPNQIIFSDDQDGKPPTMTWRYDLPRFLTKINIIPLPFHLDETVSPEEEVSEIPCVIRYWDCIEQNYVTYGNFFLSQTESCTVLLPDPTEVTSESAIAAEEWQVVVDVAIESGNDEESDDDDIPHDILERVTSVYKTPVSSISLAACMKINSCYLPSKIPYLSCSASIGCLQITLMNHFNATEHEQSPRFSPFFLDPFTYPSEQEAILINMNDFNCKTSHLGGRNPLHSIGFELDLGVDVMSYDNLSWRKSLSLNTVAAEMSLEMDSEKKNNSGQSLMMQKSKISLEVEAIEMYLSQTIVHTVVMTSDHWLNYQSKETHTPLLSHYIICNETEDVIRFGQSGTDEDLILASGQIYPYCWRSPHEQSLHLCIDSIGDWKWTNPFTIDDEYACTRTIQHNTHQSVLHIEVNQVSGIQKQIIIKGGVIFRNCLSKDVEFEVILHHAELVGSLQQQKISQVVKRFLVPSGTTRPSVSCSPGTIIAVYLRFSGNDESQGWTTSLPLAQDEFNDVSIPLTLEDKDGTKNCWYSVSSIQNVSYTQLQVCVCPYFIVRNHLRWPVTMTATSRDGGDIYTCLSRGQGRETEVFGLDVSTWYNVTFQLEGTNECTNPPLAVNTTFIDLLKKKQRVDTQNYVYEKEWPYIDGCSIPEEEPPKIVSSSPPSPTTSSSSSSMPELTADLRCQLLQKWPYLPTIIIEIKPKFIINNNSSIDLVLRDPEMHLTWELLKGSAVTSPAIQNSIQFGIERKDAKKTHWSCEVRMIDHVKPQNYHVNQENDVEEISPHSATSFSIIDFENSFCYQFAISSKKRDGITIINIKERFAIHNCTGLQLRCLPVLSATGDKEPSNGTLLDIPDSKDPLFHSKISLHQQSEGEGNVPDLSKLELKFCFCDFESCPIQFDRQQIFNLSREHLRENVVFKQQSGECLLLAVTSHCQDGVINVFIDEDPCPCFIFVNHTKQDLLIRSKYDEKSLASKRKIVNVEHQEEVDLCVGGTVQFQPKRFNTRFPKMENSRLGLFQIAAYPELIVFSDDIEINRDIKEQKINIGPSELSISCQQSSNTFHVFFTDTAESIASVRQSINLPIINLSVSKISLIAMDYKPFGEVLALTISEASIQHQIIPIESGFHQDTESLLSIEVGSIQIDNQLTDDYGHFPVFLLPLREASKRYRGEVSQNAPLADAHASSKFSFLSLKTRIYCSKTGEIFVSGVKLTVQPLEVYIEDSFIYRIISLVDSYSPPRISNTASNSMSRDETSLRMVANQILRPVNVGRIEISDIKILLSIHASVKMYLATDHMPVVLGRFECDQVITTSRELSRCVLYHYATEALVRAGLMLGSLEILANPTGFIRSIGQGVVDFFTLPYDGLTRGPSAFVSGITRGMRSFVRHTSVGALTSITNFASSLSRNLDRLSLDENHVIWQEEHRRRMLSQASPGFRDAISSLAVSLLGAVAGIVEHPITNIQNSDDARQAVRGAVTGFGKGLVGMVTKPLGGAMELVSQTGQGILLGTGLVIPPMKVRRPLCKEEIKRMEIESYMKYCWKVIRLDFERFSDLFIIDDVYITSVSDKHGYKGAIILTSSALYLYDKDENNIRKAFSCNEIILRQSQDGPYRIIVDSIERASSEYGRSQISDCGYSVEKKTVTGSGLSNKCFPVYLQMNPRFALLLLSEFTFQRNIIEEKLANELETMNIAILSS